MAVELKDVLSVCLCCVAVIPLTKAICEGEVGDSMQDVLSYNNNLTKTEHDNVYRISLQKDQYSGWHVIVDLRFSGHAVLPRDCLEVLYITTSSDHFNKTINNDTIYLPNPGFRYGNVILDLFSEWNQPVDNIAVIYDHFGKDIVKSLVLSLDGIYVQTMLTSDKTDDVATTLRDILTSSDTRIFVVVATPNIIKKIIREAVSMDLLLPSYTWFIINETNSPIAEIEYSNIFILYDYQTEVFSSILTKQIFSQTNQLIENNASFYNNTFCCLHLECTDQRRTLKETIINTLEKVMNFSCNKVSLYRYTDDIGYVTEFGNWTMNARLQIINNDDDDRIPILRVVTLPENPFVVKLNTTNGTVYTGLMFEALEYLSEHAGFRYMTKECRDGEYGAYDEVSKTWSGCIADVADGTADLIVGPLTATSERQTAVDFPVPYIGYSGLQMLKIRDTREIFFFGDVLSVPIWLCIIGTVIVTGILVTFFEKFNQPKETEITDLKEGFWFSVSAIVYAGSGKTPCRISSRLIIAGYWFSCALIMSAFTANMAAFLTISRLDDSFDSLEKVAENYAINLTVVKGTATMSYFKHMSTIEQGFADIWERMNIRDDPRVRRMPVWDYPLGEKYIVIWKRMLGTGLMPSSAKAVEAIRTDQIVLVIDSAFVKNYVERNCDLEAPAKPFSSRPYGYAIRKRSKYLEKFSKLAMYSRCSLLCHAYHDKGDRVLRSHSKDPKPVKKIVRLSLTDTQKMRRTYLNETEGGKAIAMLLEMQQYQILEEIKTKWWDKDKITCAADSETDQGLTLFEMLSIFTVAAIGVVLGILFFLCEVIADKIMRQTKTYGIEEDIGEI